MSERPVKAHPTLGCCGLDCGLCPRYYTVGASRCPGCCGPGFFEKHPSCGYITCCVKRKNLEVCGQCDEFPCSRFAPWLDSPEQRDSFLTYRRVKGSLESIRDHGVGRFIEQQARRIKLLREMIADFDDGRSRGFYCIAATLLEIADLEAALREAGQIARSDGVAPDDTKTRAGLLRAILNDYAQRDGVELKLRK